MNTNNISVPISWLSPVDWPGNYSIFSLLKLARVETFEGGKRTLLECQQINLNGLVLKRDCTVLSRIEKQPCPSGHHFFPLRCGGGKTTRVSPFLEGSGDAIKSLQENQWFETFYT